MNVREKIDAGTYQTTLIRPAGSLRYTDSVRYFDELQARIADQAKLDEVFKADLAAEHGLTEHPKLDRLFEIAWSSHAHGLHQVADTFAELSDLLEPTQKKS